MATVIIEDLIKSRCGYCFSRRSWKGLDVATLLKKVKSDKG